MELRALANYLLRIREESGQAMIEFALACTLLLPILFGVCVFGFAMNNYLALTEATGTGARQLAIERGQGGDACAITASTIAAAAPLLANTGSSTTGLGYNITINGVAYGSTCPNATLNQGASVIVSTTYPCSLKVYSRTYVSNCYLNASTSEVLQ
jgi:Flp pilus assembly protein TadG